MKTIGIMTGVFNPPHNFHFTIANEILKNNINIEKIIFVPTNNNYKKDDVIDGEHRYNMLKLVADKSPNLEVSRFEIDQQTQPYSIDTLSHFKSEYPEHQISLIIGSDNLKTFDKWHDYKNILTTYSPIIYERDTDTINGIINTHPFLIGYKNYIRNSNCYVASDLSSTKIRNLIRSNKKINNYVPYEIEKYIISNKLYVLNPLQD